MKTKRNKKSRRGGTWPWSTPTDPILDNIADQIIELIKDNKQIDRTIFNGIDLKKLKLALIKKINYFHPHIKGRYNNILNFLDTSFDVSTSWTVTSSPSVYREANAILGYVCPEIRAQKIIELLKESENLDGLSEVLDKQINTEEREFLGPKFKEAKDFKDAKRYASSQNSWDGSRN
jgi:hypothetical protein